MIGFLRGILISKSAPDVLLDVNGVGYNLQVPMSTFYELPETGISVQLLTHLSIREDAHLLFGFLSSAERELFQQLIRINGVGPKLALAILSGMSFQEFHRHIFDNNITALTKLPGVGKKTAERLVIEMRDRLPATSDTDSTPALVSQQQTNPATEAVNAMIALGYNEGEAKRLIRKIADDDLSCEQMIKLALQSVHR